MADIDPAEPAGGALYPGEAGSPSGGTARAGPAGTVQETLRHLLDVEAQANALAADAQKEAQDRIAEAEKQFRARFDAAYAARAAEIETEFGQKIAAVNEEYRKKLDAFRAELDAMPVNRAAFGALLGRLLAENPGNEGRPSGAGGLVDSGLPARAAASGEN
jgi:hypothetical protein